jgi:hypothetical protein
MPRLFTQLRTLLGGGGTEFYDSFEALADHAVSCARRLHELAGGVPEESPECRRIHEEEAAADAVNHRMQAQLRGVFMPPIEPGDVLALAEAIDDVIDQMDEASKRFCLYHVREVQPEFAEQMAILTDAAQTMRDAIGTLRRSRWLSDLRPALEALSRHERRGDACYHAALSRLFGAPTDPITVLRWQDLFTLGERAIDCCQSAGHVIERVALHNEG